MADYDQLLAIAHTWAQELAQRPGVVGVFLYGSLARGPETLHEFSDVDLALVLEDSHLPAYYAEHRLLDGVKTDTTLTAASTLDGWQQKPPARMFENGWVNSLFLTALSGGKDSIILYDPQNRVHQAMVGLSDYETLALPDVRRWLADYKTERLEKEALTPENIYERLHPGHVNGLIRFWADDKSLSGALTRLGLPELIEKMARWSELLEFPDAHLERVCDAYTRIGALAHTEFYSRVEVPGDLEIAGEWNRFWPGNRVHIIERLLSELPLTLRWSESLRQQGKISEARYTLWPCDPADIRRRTAALRDALQPLGYDISDLTESFLSSPELSASEAELTSCLAGGAQCRISDADRAEIIDLITRVLAQLESRAAI